ncbi:hypothetical protein COU54_01580 [Candidatus Pacearchaeota archaeon CG10_big_fil_rev_8_21_14_0_10_31_24]|nr:MAG: hypothetical protein COU54_01580 [Candidatus Pacearchaeota archaeon CG10_big_fil_rev_8_21_14_0_10_31_24]
MGHHKIQSFAHHLRTQHSQTERYDVKVARRSERKGLSGGYVVQIGRSVIDFDSEEIDKLAEYIFDRIPNKMVPVVAHNGTIMVKQSRGGSVPRRGLEEIESNDLVRLNLNLSQQTSFEKVRNQSRVECGVNIDPDSEKSRFRNDNRHGYLTDLFLGYRY